MRRWRDIAGFEGRYQVSDDGFVRSLARVDRLGRKRSGKLLALRDYEGYLRVALGHPAVERKVHRLVAEAFIPNPNNLPHVNHRDGDTSNNRRRNLEWVTISENLTHSYRVLGRKPAMLGRTGALCQNSRPVVGRCCATGNEVTFCSATAAGIASGGTSGSAVGQAANGKIPRAYGFAWRWA